MNIYFLVIMDHYKRFLDDVYEAGTGVITDKYIEGFIDYIETGDLIVSIPKNTDTVVSKFNIFKAHPIYNVNLLAVGQKLLRLKTKESDVEYILHDLTGVYLNNVISIKYIYLMLCRLMFDCLHFDTFIKEYALCPSNDEIVQELQRLYKIDNDDKYVYLINIYLRHETQAFDEMHSSIKQQIVKHWFKNSGESDLVQETPAVTLEHTLVLSKQNVSSKVRLDAYLLASSTLKDKLDNMQVLAGDDEVFTSLSNVISSASNLLKEFKAIKNKRDLLVEKAYSTIADNTTTHLCYAIMLKNIDFTKEIDMTKLLNPTIRANLSGNQLIIAEIMHTANLKKAIKIY